MTRVSVIIPAHNAERYLGQAIKSIASQTHRDHEIVVVNDGSTDGTRDVMDAWGQTIIAVHQDNLGASTARNAGVAASFGEHLAFLDADDWLLPDTLAALSGFLDTHSDIGLVAGGLAVVDDNDQQISTQKPWLHCPGITLEDLTLVGLSGPTGVMLRRTHFDAIGGFDSELTHVEDIDFWWRLRRDGCQMAWLPQIVGGYRVHAASLTQDYLLHHQKRVSILDAHLGSGALDASIISKRPLVIARMKVALAGRLFGAGDTESGIRALLDAVALDPQLRSPDTIAEAIANWRHDSRIADRDNIVELALARLPTSLSWVTELQAHIDRYYWQYRFYTAAMERDRASVTESWIKLAANNPRWLFNRGGWSILRKSRRWPVGHDHHGAWETP